MAFQDNGLRSAPPRIGDLSEHRDRAVDYVAKGLLPQ
jgi:hypothetical protein